MRYTKNCPAYESNSQVGSAVSLSLNQQLLLYQKYFKLCNIKINKYFAHFTHNQI